MLYIASQHPSEPRRLLAFYNGGTGAGASQSWRHLQVISVNERLGAPVETWMRGVKPPGRQGQAFAHPSLPYLHLIYPLPAAQDRSFPPTEEEDEYMLGVLAKGMMCLLDDMIDAVRRNEGSQDGGWNLLITLYVGLCDRLYSRFSAKLRLQQRPHASHPAITPFVPTTSKSGSQYGNKGTITSGSQLAWICRYASCQIASGTRGARKDYV
jgi:hypothetical protein